MAFDADLSRDWAHLCVDMQTVFAGDTPWHAPWMNKVLPAVEALAEASAERTIFTRFMPPERPDEAQGAWKEYFTHWSEMTRERQSPDLFDLVPSLKRLVPPARTFDKPIYSPWLTGNLHGFLQGAGISTLVISGGESDVCVMAAVLGAIDLGYRVVLPLDALFGSADETHDASVSIYKCRFQMQLTTTSVDELLTLWRK